MAIDVSSFQGDISWPDVFADGVRLAWIRTSSGFHTAAGLWSDPLWRENTTAARAAGIQVAFYHYSYPGLNSPQVEAEHFLTVCGSAIEAGDVVPFLDFEITRGAPWPALSQRISWKAAFLAIVDRQIGTLAGFYSYRSELDLMYPHLYPERPVWISYPGALTHFELQRCSFHQYGQGNVRGISGAVDLDARVLTVRPPAPAFPVVPAKTV